MSAHEEVISVVSHDLRNPLGVIALWAQQLLRTVPAGAFGQDVEQGASSIVRNATRMTQLIDDLMDETRIRSGRLLSSVGRTSSANCSPMPRSRDLWRNKSGCGSRSLPAHGGQVWAESSPGRGSIFHVSLPEAFSSAAGA